MKNISILELSTTLQLVFSVWTSTLSLEELADVLVPAATRLAVLVNSKEFQKKKPNNGSLRSAVVPSLTEDYSICVSC